MSASSASRERLEDEDLVGRAQRHFELAHIGAVHEEPHVRAQTVLLVDHTEADPGVAVVEIDEHDPALSGFQLSPLSVLSKTPPSLPDMPMYR